MAFFLLTVQFISAQGKEDQVAKHDIDGIAKYWLPDFVQVRGNATWLAGKDTIISAWKELF